MQHMKKIYRLLFASLLLISFGLSVQASSLFDVEKPILIAKKREVILPEAAKKKSCQDVETAVINLRKEYAATMKTENKKKSTTGNDHNLENKRGQNGAKLAQEKAKRQIKLYKPEEVKSVLDAYNANIDAALDTRGKAFSAALKNYKAISDKQLGIISRSYKNYRKIIKKIVCDESGSHRGVISGSREGFGSGLADARTFIAEATEKLQTARKTANSAFKTAMRDAEKAKNDALKPLKKVK